MKLTHAQLLNIVDSNNLEELKQLISQKIDLYPLFYLFCKKGNLPFVKYLVDQGCDIHQEQDSALRSAVVMDQLEIVQYLVDQGAHIDSFNHFSIFTSIKNRNKPLFSYLLTAINKHYPETNINYLRLSIQHNSFVIFKYILDSGHYIQNDLKYALDEACHYGNILMFKYLIKKQNIVFNDNISYMSSALTSEKLSMVQFLYSLYNNKTIVEPLIQSTPNHVISSWMNSKLLNDKLELEFSVNKNLNHKKQQTVKL